MFPCSVCLSGEPYKARASTTSLPAPITRVSRGKDGLQVFALAGL